MTFTAISVTGTVTHVATDRIVCRWRLQCCRMVVTIYQQLMNYYPPTWHHQHPMTASIIASFIRYQARLMPGVIHHWEANPRLDVSWLQCTLRKVAKSPRTPSKSASTFSRLAETNTR